MLTHKRHNRCMLPYLLLLPYCLPRCTPDTSNPIYLLSSRNKRETEIQNEKKSFWLILLHLLIRPSSSEHEIQVHDAQLKTKNDKEIQKCDYD